MQFKKALLIPLLPLFSFAFLLFSETIDSSALMESRSAYLSFVVLQILTFLLPTVFFCKAKGENYIFHMRLKLFGLERAAFLVFAVAVMISSMIVVEYLMQQVGISDGLYAHSVYRLYGRTMPELGSNVYDSIYKTVVFAVVPAVTEELLFRSVLYTEYECCGVPFAIILTALLYGMLDMSLVSFFPSFFGGLLLGFSVYVTDSVFAPMLIHLVYNLYAISFEEYIWSYVSKPENESFFIFIMVTVMMVSLILMLSQARRVVYARGWDCEPLPEYLTVKEFSGEIKPGVRAFGMALTSPTYLGCCFLFLLHIFGRL